jgi:hypothetical protein
MPGFESILKAVEHVTTPIGLVAFLAALLLGGFYFFVKEGRGLGYVYELFKTKLTQERFYQLAMLLIVRVFWLSLVIVVLSFAAWVYGIYQDHQIKPNPSLEPPKRPSTGENEGGPASPQPLAQTSAAGTAFLPRNKRENAREAHSDEPSTPGSHPTFESITALPTEEAVKVKPDVPPEKVVFRYRNLTGRPLKLVLYDCYYHYYPVRAPLAPQDAWRIWDFPAGDKYQVFDQFRRGTGWFVFFVEEPGKDFVELDTKMIFYSSQPTLSVSATGNEAKPYEADFNSY